MVDKGLRFLTPKEYVFESIHKVPSVIRIEMTPEMSVFWIMGLFFNTVSNGDDLSSLTVDKDTEVSDYKWGSHGFPADGMILKSGHRVSFQDDPKVGTRCDPYPNFSKEKSIVWSQDEFSFESMGWSGQRRLFGFMKIVLCILVIQNFTPAFIEHFRH